MRDISGVSTRKLDECLTHLFDDIRQDQKNPLLREFAILSLGTMIEQRPEFSLSIYLHSHGKYIGESLSQLFLATYSYETLRQVESVSAALCDVSSEYIPGGRDVCLTYTKQRLEEIESDSIGSAHEEVSATSEDDRSDDWQVTSKAGPVWGALVTGYPPNNPIVSVGKVLEFKLGLEISGEWSRKHKRETVEFGGSTLMKKDEFENQLRESVRYAESQFVEKYKAREIPGLNRRYQFEAYSGIHSYSNTPYTGGSAGLAKSLLSMTALDGLRVRSRQRRIHSGTACTGQIDSEGNVLGVKDSEIPAKTKAVFRSSCSRFVVPEKNFDTARKTLDELNSEHPDRHLELIAAANVRDVYESDDISSEKMVSVPSIAINKARRKRKTLLASISSAVAIVALAVVGIFSLVFFTEDVSSVRFDGHRIEFVNRFDRVYKEFELPYHVNVKGDNNYTDTSGKSHRLIIDDITGDGNRELLFIGVAVNSGSTDHFGTVNVHLFDEEGDELSHVEAFDSVKMTTKDGSRFIRDISYNKDVVVDLNGDRFKEVVLYFVERLWAPSGVVVFSLKEKSAQTFFHNGNLQNLIVDDCDDDGVPDIIVTTECNYIDTSALIVLDPDHVQGSSPKLKGLQFDGYEGNVAKYMIFLPQSIVFKNQSKNERPSIRTLFLNTAGRVQIGVCEYKLPDTCASLLYEFSADWNCASVSDTDPYWKEFIKYYDDGDIERNSDEYDDYLNSLKSEFRYLNGDTLTFTPGMNSGYMAHANETS